MLKDVLVLLKFSFLSNIEAWSILNLDYESFLRASYLSFKLVEEEATEGYLLDLAEEGGL